MNIQLSDTACLLNDQVTTVTVELTDSKCFVDVCHGDLNNHLDTRTTISSEYMSDVDHLADAFAFEPVIVFKIIVNLLGKAQKLRDL